MKGKFLLFVFIFLLLAGAFGSDIGHFFCASSDPTTIVAGHYQFKDEAFFFEFSNNTDGNIGLVSVEAAEANFKVNPLSPSSFAQGETVRIEGTYLKESLNLNVHGFIEGKILINYLDSSGNKKNATIFCMGPPEIQNPTNDFFQSLFQIAPYILLFLGLLGVVFGHFKQRGNILIFSLLLIAIVILHWLSSAWIVY